MASSTLGTRGTFKQYSGLFWLLGGIVAALLVANLPLGLSEPAQTTLAVFVFTIAVWIGEVLPTGLGALVWAGLLVVLLGKAMPASTVFSGFAKDTTWLMLGAFLIGEATTETKLAHRIAYRLMSLGGSSYSRVVLFLWISMFVLGLIVPSGAVRMAIFIPIMLGIGDAFGAKPSSAFAANILLNVYWSSMCAEALWYTATNLNLTAMGVLEELTGYHPSWIAWLVHQIVPVGLMTVGSYLIINKLFRPEEEYLQATGGVQGVRERLEELGPVSSAEKRALVFFIATIILWATEPFHKVSSAWVAAFVGALLFLPGIGVLDPKSLNKISWNTVLLMGLALGMGSVMAQVKLDAWLSQKLLGPVLGPLGSSLGSFGLALGIALFGGIVHFIMPSGSAQTAALSPLVIKYAITSGFDPQLAAMVIPRACSQLLIFPYQSVPLMVLWGTGYMNTRKCVISFGVMSLFLLVWQALMGPYWSWIMHVVKF